MDQPGVVASPARGHLKKLYYVVGPLLQQNHVCLLQENNHCTNHFYDFLGFNRPLTAAALRSAD